MKRLLTVLVTGAALLALAGPATAKELSNVRICGGSGCTTITDREQLRALPLGSQTTASPPPTAPFYRVEFAMDAGRETHRFAMYYVPSANLLGANGELPGRLAWLRIYGAATKTIRDAVRGLEPYAAPKRWPSDIATPKPVGAPAPTAPSPDGGRPVAVLVVAALAAVLTALVALAVVLRRHRRVGAAAPSTG